MTPSNWSNQLAPKAVLLDITSLFVFPIENVGTGKLQKTEPYQRGSTAQCQTNNSCCLGFVFFYSACWKLIWPPCFQSSQRGLQRPPSPCACLTSLANLCAAALFAGTKIKPVYFFCPLSRTLPVDAGLNFWLRQYLKQYIISTIFFFPLQQHQCF